MTQRPFNSTIEQSQMAEAKKIRDREMRGIRSTNFIQCYFDRKNKGRIQKIKYINDIIEDLERYGPAGLIHIAVLSSIIERPIKIWNANGSLNKIIGRRKTGHHVDIEYHATEGVGHWTLKGGKDPDNVITDLNSCLFSVIGCQIGQDPLKLRKWTVLKLKNNFQNLAKWIDKVKLERNDKMILMIGGAARYSGTKPAHAKTILDRSENREGNCYRWRDTRQAKSYRHYLRGHARGHSMKICSETDPYQTVVQYARSKSADKAGFLSRKDQDFVADLALRTETAKTAMRKLSDSKNPSYYEEILISAESLTEVCSGKCSLPQIKVWNKNGEEYPCSLEDLKNVKLLLTHQPNKRWTRDNADVFVITFYPIVNNRYQYY
ncbi:uncharacterized protein LOC143906933 [Temnothorax americanus]|uniref:uncharacterized protein LOC143906933 n=1 Tax=Temnothorax americanus TaxID=1964332 RepID=UPI0040693DBF